MDSKLASHSSRIIIENDTDRPRIAWVEPWGEDYTLLPKEKLEIIARSDLEPPWFHVDEYAEGSQIYIEGIINGYDVVQNGIKLECGDQRKAALDAGIDL